MRIHGSQNTDCNEKAISEKTRAQEAVPAKSERSPESTAALRGETVLISNQASQAVEASAATDRRFADRVEELKAQVEAGTYQVDRRRLVENILGQELTPRREQ